MNHLSWVVHQREQTLLPGGDDSSTDINISTSASVVFRWPYDIDALSVL